MNRILLCSLRSFRNHAIIPSYSSSTGHGESGVHSTTVACPQHTQQGVVDQEAHACFMRVAKWSTELASSRLVLLFPACRPTRLYSRLFRFDTDTWFIFGLQGYHNEGRPGAYDARDCPEPHRPRQEGLVCAVGQWSNETPPSGLGDQSSTSRVVISTRIQQAVGDCCVTFSFMFMLLLLCDLHERGFRGRVSRCGRMLVGGLSCMCIRLGSRTPSLLAWNFGGVACLPSRPLACQVGVLIFCCPGLALSSCGVTIMLRVHVMTPW